MATVNIVHDIRRAKEDNTFPVYLRLIHDRQTRNIPLGYDVSSSDWNAKSREVKNSFPNSTRVNLFFQRKLTDAKRVIVDNEYNLSNLTIEQLKNLIVSFDSSQNSETGMSFMKYSEEIIARLKKAKRFGSAVSYGCCVSCISKFMTGKKELMLTNINYKFLIDFEAYCLGNNLKINSIGNYMRSLRAIINLAIDEGLLKQEQYPFRKYKIKKEKTQKRAISKKDIQSIINLELEKDSAIWHNKNFFAFIFYMRGMNFIDLAFLKRENIQGERIIYNRIKTKKLYDIKITKPASMLLEIYLKDKEGSPNDLVFPILPQEILKQEEKAFKLYKERRKAFNSDLKKMGRLCNIETKVTSYVIRHTWASIAKFSGITPALIGESLGHSDLKTTETYLANFDHQMLDEANEIIINSGN